MFSLGGNACAIVVAALFVCLLACPTSAEFNVGTGIYDITGPAASFGMMGYAMTNQTSGGISFRVRSRAFVVDDGAKRVAVVVTDSCMIFTAVKRVVVEKLQKKYGTLYSHDNVLLSGTHTHSAPGGYSEYLIFDLTSWGFDKGNFEVITDGIVTSIEMAHNSMKSGVNLFLNSDILLDSNINRSPTAYLNNPASERAKYQYDVDKLMTLLKFQGKNGEDIGLINWFAVHCTTMNNTNLLISGDNKGYASYVYERYMNGNDTLPGLGPFIAAFAQSNEGDVSPNTLGAFCWDGTPCETVHSTCGGRSQGCHGYGPGKNNDNFESVEIIGGNQFRKAKELYETAKEIVSGPIAYAHTFIKIDSIVVTPEYSGQSSNVTTCLAALGGSFAGGTTDGPGDFNFVQGTNSTTVNPYWNYIASFLSNPTPEQKKCQHPKPILLNVGGINFPSPWEPSILPIQLIRIGQLVIIGVPAEFSTMAGRRLRDTVSSVLMRNGLNATVVISGLSNAYSHYVTTQQEFVYQRYEGASTLYGPHTLAAYQQEFAKLSQALATGKSVPPGPSPPNLSDKTFNFRFPNLEDNPPLFGKFGDLDKDVQPSYVRGTTAKASFWGGWLSNHYLTQSNGFMTVERLNEATGEWDVIFNDGSWETKVFWERVWLTQNRITVTWDIPTYLPPGGKYRMSHHGYWKSILGGIHPYTGYSSVFTLA